MVRDGDHLIVGGNFQHAGSIQSHNLARYHIPSDTWSALAGGTENEVTALMVVGDTLWVGLSGAITTIPRIHLPSQTWHHFEGLTLKGPVRSMRSTSEGLFVGAQFPNGENIQKYQNGVWTNLSGSLSGTVYGMSENDSFLYVGGAFTINIESVISQGIARYQIADNRWEAIVGGDLNSEVRSLASIGDDIIVGGYFDEAGSKAVSRIARWSEADGKRSGKVYLAFRSTASDFFQVNCIPLL